MRPPSRGRPPARPRPRSRRGRRRRAAPSAGVPWARRRAGGRRCGRRARRGSGRGRWRRGRRWPRRAGLPGSEGVSGPATARPTPTTATTATAPRARCRGAGVAMTEDPRRSSHGREVRERSRAGDNGGMSSQPMRPGLRAALSLDYPMSLGVYDSYDDAQRAVDYLSDHEFPVQDVLIVGTDLKQLERVTGRLTRGRAMGGGALSGAWLGLFIGIMFALFDPNGFNLVSVLATVAFGSLFGAGLERRGLPVHQRRTARLHLGQPRRRREVRGAVRAQARPARPGDARRDGPDARRRAGGAPGPRGRAGPRGRSRPPPHAAAAPARRLRPRSEPRPFARRGRGPGLATDRSAVRGSTLLGVTGGDEAVPS